MSWLKPALQNRALQNRALPDDSMLVDTHCHLNHEQFSSDMPDAVVRALESGVERMIVVGFDLASSAEAIGLAERHNCLFAAVAIHPTMLVRSTMQVKRR